MARIKQLIIEKLDSLNVGDSFDKQAFVRSIWKDADEYYATRSFDVHYCNIKKLFPEKVFKVILGKIKREV